VTVRRHHVFRSGGRTLTNIDERCAACGGPMRSRHPAYDDVRPPGGAAVEIEQIAEFEVSAPRATPLDWRAGG